MASRHLASAGLLLALLACSPAEEGPPRPEETPAPEAPGTSTSPGATSTGSPDSTGAAPPGGPADDPAVVEAGTDLLAWEPAGAPPDQALTTNGEWTLVVSQDRRSATLRGPDGETTYAAKGRQVSDALLTDTHALVVLQDQQEQDPSTATLVDLATGEAATLDGRSRPPTTTGGTWALGTDTLVHATIKRRDYCLASVDLATGRGSVPWCVPPRHGFNGARITATGTTLQTFDDSQPSCRTVGTLEGSAVEPLPEVTPCKAWDAVVLGTGPVWSVVPRENNVESVLLRARTAAGHVDLGPGTSGTLTACGGAAYFVRDPQGEDEPARLVRWDGTSLDVVYESPSGPAFLDTPRCGGSILTVGAFADGGDEQVSAPVG